MGLIVRDITATGFGSYGPRPQRLTLGGRGPVAIVGENGAGKSTIVSKALTWCLFGKTAPDRMGGGTKVLRGDAVIGDGCSAAEVTVRLTDDDTATEYTITRSKSRKKGGALTMGRTDPSGAHDMDPSQEAIEGLIGADYDTLTRTVVRGQGDVWAFAEATDAKKREVLDAISGAAALDDAHKRATVARKAAAARHTDLTRRVADMDRRGNDHRTRAAAMESQHATWEAERETRIKRAKADVVTATAALVTATAADAGRATLQAQHDTLKASTPTLDLTPYRDAMSAADDDMRAATRTLDAAEADLARLEALAPGEACPTCGQTIAADAPIADNHNAARDAVAAAQQPHVAIHRAACWEAQHTAEAWLADEQRKHRDALLALPRLGSEREPVARLSLDAAQKRLTTTEAADNPFTVAWTEATRQHRNLLREVVMLRVMATEANRDLAKAEAWESALHPRGARAHMASAALGAVERGACEWLTVLSDNRMAVEFPEDTERERIGTVVTMDGGERDLLSYSGGERRRVNMAVDLGVSSAFARGGLALSLLVMDEEVFSGMDEAGKAAVVHALHGAGVADVVVVDHDPRLSAVLPRCVEVVRGSDGYSEIREVDNA